MKRKLAVLLLMVGLVSFVMRAQEAEELWNAGVSLGYGTDVSKGFYE